MGTQSNPDWQATATTDPAFGAWHDAAAAADDAAFEAWLDTPEGRAWLYASEFEAISRKEMGYAQH